MTWLAGLFRGLWVVVKVVGGAVLRGLERAAESVVFEWIMRRAAGSPV